MAQRPAGRGSTHTSYNRPGRCVMRRWLVILAAVTALATAARADEGPRLFPFVLPWDDASAGAADVSDWLPKPAGKLGPVRAGQDGHLYTGDQRVRFFGV